jgi:hypothetical protein
VSIVVISRGVLEAEETVWKYMRSRSSRLIDYENLMLARVGTKSSLYTLRQFDEMGA